MENPADALTKVVTRALQLQYRAFLGLVNVQQILASLCAPLICQDLHDSCQEMSSSDSEAESEPQSDVEKGFFNAEGKFQGPTLSLNFSGDSEFVADFLRDVRVFGLQHAEKSEIEDMWNSWRCDYLHRYLMIEFCCAPDSLLADQWMNQGEKYVAWRVTCGGELTEVLLHLQATFDRFVASREKCFVWFHCSLPCSGGSPLNFNRHLEDGRRQRLNLVRALFKQLLKQANALYQHIRSKCQNTQFTFELAKTCTYWKWKCLDQIRRWSPGLVFAALVRLCQCREGRVNQSIGISKTWRVLSNSESVVRSLNRKFSNCECHQHILPSYSSTAFYPRSLCEALVALTIQSLIQHRESEEPKDDLSSRPVWLK